MTIVLKRLVLTAAAATLLIISLSGCGGSGETTAVSDNADAAAIAEYERMVAESEAAANSDGTK